MLQATCCKKHVTDIILHKTCYMQHVNKNLILDNKLLTTCYINPVMRNTNMKYIDMSCTSCFIERANVVCNIFYVIHSFLYRIKEIATCYKHLDTCKVLCFLI